MKIPVLLSANFGELRINHFHSGVDIKTQGVTGKEVVAAASGYIYRITVSPGGFGKALYIKHPSGYSTVYGHLERFAPEIDEYVKSRQYEMKSFLVTLYPSRDQFQVKQGELIAYSGNSGSSGGPHLHFEIRKSESEIPVNPLLFHFEASDKTKPVIEKLLIYPSNKHSFINNQNKKRGINLSGGNGNYSLPADSEINISGIAGFGIKSFDQLDDSNNRCAVYSIELLIDSTTIYKYVMDEFSFNESRYINSHIDYETFMRDNIYVERTFTLPNDKLSVYKYLVNRGLYNFNDGKTHHAQIVVTDVSGNKATLRFKVKAVAEKTSLPSEPAAENVKVMPFNKSNRFESENVSVYIPSGALYDTLNFTYKKCAGTREMFSDIHCINNSYTPVNKPYSLSLKPLRIPEGKRSKMLIVQLDADDRKTAVSSSWSEGFLTAEVMTFGRFFIGIDTVAPEISAYGLSRGAVLTGKKEIRFRISDDLSGINSYEPTIDGKWALFEYDQKNNVLIYRFDEKFLTPGTKHNLYLKVSDNKDNISTYSCDFTW